jgi:L-aspartate oxidase
MQTEILVIGSGIAGATAALRLAADTQRQITVIARTPDPLESNSSLAQGGIVARGTEDTADLLIQDIVRAGDEISNPAAIRIIAEQGPELLQEILIDQVGLAFDRDESGDYAYGVEAAHSTRRILHVGDATGNAIMKKLMAALSECPNVQILTSYTAIDLLTFPHHSLDPLAIYRPTVCHGAYVFDRQSKQVIPILASKTIMATGGLGQIFLSTTNTASARGDGLGMAYRAGARVINLEYIQFHPTAFSMHGSTKFLISEAVRGEGGVLINPDGEAFMERYAPEWKDLAPRDEVARAIYWEMLEKDLPNVFLDIASRHSAGFLKDRFPQIYQRCLQHGVDITQQPIPVLPAAHYFCGGVQVDEWGQSSMKNLYAIGEVSCTGVHGANRLASTSLLEGIVWGDRTAQSIRNGSTEDVISEDSIPAWLDDGLIYDADPALIQGDMQDIRNMMWHYVGLVRSEYRLRRAVRELRHLWMEVDDFYRKTRLSDGLIGLRNSVQVALIVSQAALRNKISRGAHYRDDGIQLPDDSG